ncbi:nuclear transport factor 2 family protein [Spirosoma sp. KNUC1025]|uniref:nuclear transport factor 2 family protein n=1 Tax=Spirosoma sp. KNUC1025 TaxID=2894082 RepID=UPI003865898D|nr:nuclear transport factor 2 family protein [Spirosoma sp. KNUC1025]
MSSLSEQVVALTQLIETNQTIEAMERFYTDNVTMQENDQPPRVGKAVCLAHERKLLAAVTELSSKLVSQAINEETGIVFSEWYMESTYPSGKRFSLNEVSVQHWVNNLICQEKFYYNSVIQLEPA